MIIDQTQSQTLEDSNQLEIVEVNVILNGKETILSWNKQVPLLDAVINAGIDAPYSCCRGNCGTCVCKLEEGEVRLRRNFILTEAHIEQGLILPCTATFISDKIKINYDEF